MSDPAGTPPRWAEWLLERVLVSADRQTVVGDLHEEYREEPSCRTSVRSGLICGTWAKF